MYVYILSYLKKEYNMCKKIAICGYSPTLRYAPFDNSEWLIYGMNHKFSYFKGRMASKKMKALEYVSPGIISRRLHYGIMSKLMDKDTRLHYMSEAMKTNSTRLIIAH